MNKIDEIRGQLIQPKKLQLHSGISGFESPDAFGIYRHTGGKPLGVVGSVYTPPDLGLLLDTIVQSVDKCCPQLNLDQMSYSEMKEGSKIRISIPSPSFEVTSKVVGDTYQMRLDFVTGFDGLTKTSLSSFGYRLVCLNGAKRWKKDVELSFKNTPGNKGKLALFCDEILTVLRDNEDYQTFLNKAASIQFTQAQKDAFFTKLLGYNEKEYKDLTTRKKNILDKINASVAVETHDLGPTMYALLNGITRYTSHDLAGGQVDKLMTDLPMTMNKVAHSLIYEMMN